MSATLPTLAVHGLAKGYAGTKVLERLDLEVGAGEIVALLGRNGAGKTTALECILGLRQPDAGAVQIGGIDALRSPIEARRFVGAQLQSAALQDQLTPTQALRYFGSFYPHRQPVHTILERFGLSDKANATFARLSGGQKQRLFLALAFLHDPKLVILDEPTASLDPQARRELHACITSARRSGVAVLLSTHDLDEASELCDRVAILHDGRVVAIGVPGAMVAASRATARLSIVTVRPLGTAILRDLEAAEIRVTRDSDRSTHAVLESRHIEVALGRLAEKLVAENNRLESVHISPPTLEDVFFEHTGVHWREESHS